MKLARAALLQLRIYWQLRTRTFGKFQTQFSPPAGAPKDSAEVLAWKAAVQRTGSKLKTTCLVQALALKYLAPETHLRIGVANQNGFEAHAWVEYQGQVILGDVPDFAFVPIWEMK
jgi:hypothetical protein